MADHFGFGRFLGRRRRSLPGPAWRYAGLGGGLPAAQAAVARSSVAVATRLGGAVAVQAHTAFADGMHLALLIAAGIAAAAAIMVATLLRRRPGQVPGHPRGEHGDSVLRSPDADVHEAGDVPAPAVMA